MCEGYKHTIRFILDAENSEYKKRLDEYLENNKIELVLIPRHKDMFFTWTTLSDNTNQFKMIT